MSRKRCARRSEVQTIHRWRFDERSESLLNRIAVMNPNDFWSLFTFWFTKNRYIYLYFAWFYLILRRVSSWAWWSPSCVSTAPPGGRTTTRSVTSRWWRSGSSSPSSSSSWCTCSGCSRNSPALTGRWRWAHARLTRLLLFYRRLSDWRFLSFLFPGVFPLCLGNPAGLYRIHRSSGEELQPLRSHSRICEWNLTRTER